MTKDPNQRRSVVIKIALLGPPGSGKGAQSVRLRERFPDLCYINPSMMLRDEISRHTALGVDAQEKMLKGVIIPTDTYTQLILDKARSSSCAAGYILDGAPSDVYQAEALEKNAEHLDAAVFLDLDDETVLRRTSGRWVHQRSGRIYHDYFARPKQPYKDDETGEPLVQRSDDTPAVASERLSQYKKNAAAIRQYYSHVVVPNDSTKQNPQPSDNQSPLDGITVFPPSPIPLLSVDGNASMDTVRGRLFGVIQCVIDAKIEAARRKAQWWRFWSR